MPRDSAGNFTLVPGNPVQSGTVVSSTWANSTLDDVSTALTDSLDRYGRGGMLAPFKFSDGTNLLPGAAWVNEPTTGFYRFDGGDLRAAVLTQDVMRWQSTGAQVWNSTDAQWNDIVGGGSGQTGVDTGTAADNTLRWSGTAWVESASLTVSTTAVTVVGVDLLSPGAGANSFRAGPSAGTTSQGVLTVAVGNLAGNDTQGDYGVGVGYASGQTDQATSAVAVGRSAGNNTQGQHAVAIGTEAGKTTQGGFAVAVGREAGETTQGANSVALGRLAGQTNQGDNGIIINASGVALDDTTNGHIHIASDDGSIDFTTVGGWSLTGGNVVADGYVQGARFRSSANGSNSLPAFTFSSNTDTGMYRVTGNKVGFSSNGTEAMVVGATEVDVTGTVNAVNGELVGSSDTGTPAQPQKMETLTQLEYDALSPTYDANTLYFIVG